MKTKAMAIIILTLFLASMLSMAFNIAPATAISGTNVKGYWHFDEGAGNIAYDSSDYANDGILSGGKFGNALQFDGVGDYVEVPADPSLNFGYVSHTVELWFKPTELPTGTHYMVLYHSVGGGWGINQYGYNLYVYRTYSSPKLQMGGYFTAEDIGQWIHIAIVFDASTKKMIGYKNGYYVAEGSVEYSWGGMPMGPTTIGRVVGAIDEVRISNATRTSFDLIAPPSVDANTVGLWHFDEGTGSIAYDSSLNANHGTIYGATWTGTPPTWVEGKYGKALSFDGMDDYIGIPGTDFSFMTEDNDFTVELWFKTSDTSSAFRTIFIKRTTSGPHVGEITIRPDHKLQVDSWNGAQWFGAYTPFTVNDGMWHHVVLVHFFTGYITGYCDGVSFGDSPTEIGTTGNNEDVRVGSDTALGRFFPGVIDEVRIWDIALPAEVVAVAATGTMEYLDIAGLVIFTSVFEDLPDSGTVTIQILADPGVSITGVDIHRLTPKRKYAYVGACATGTLIDDFSISVEFCFGSPPCKTIHLWLYLNTGEHIGVNLQRAR